jgi:hypothetical protein
MTSTTQKQPATIKVLDSTDSQYDMYFMSFEHTSAELRAAVELYVGRLYDEDESGGYYQVEEMMTDLYALGIHQLEYELATATF